MKTGILDNTISHQRNREVTSLEIKNGDKCVNLHHTHAHMYTRL